jgi:uncharacterized protein (DUF4415 family)
MKTKKRGSARTSNRQAKQSKGPELNDVLYRPKDWPKYLRKDLPKGDRGDRTWVDPDDAPEWTQQQLESADLYRGDKLVRRGRPPTGNPKLALKLRIDSDVVEHFRATGPGWQTRINDALRRAAKLPASRSIRGVRAAERTAHKSA